MSLEDLSLDADQVTGELVIIKYLRLDIAKKLIKDGELLFKQNPKKHDLAAIAISIKENGFVDPAKWDNNLNNGKGGLVFGNGRTYSSVQVLEQMFLTKQPKPKGVGEDSEGNWYIPIKFGADADSELAAKRFAIDHNNLTMAGGDFTPADMMRMWDGDDYLELAKELADNDILPITMDGDDLDLLIALADDSNSFIAPENPSLDDQSWEDSLEGLPEGDRATMSTMTFTLSKEQVEQIELAIAKAKEMYELDISVNKNLNGNALAKICELFITKYGQS